MLDIGNAHDAQYDKISGNYSKLQSSRRLRNFLLVPSMLSMMDSLSGKSVLDVGCGDGNFARLMMEKGVVSVAGSDISAKMVEIARAEEEKLHLGIKYYVHGLKNTPKLGDFDIVTGINVLHYAWSEEELAGMCKSIARNLKPGCQFVGFVQNPEFDFSKDTRPYGFHYEHVKAGLEDGDDIRVTLTENGISVSFDICYWSKRTYERLFGEMGFSEVVWPEIVYDIDSDRQFCEGYMRNPGVIPIRCTRA